MLKTTTSRLAAFAAGLAVIGGGAAAAGSATNATPPLQDCLRLAAAEAGLDDTAASKMGAGHAEGSEPMVQVVPGSDGLRSELAGLMLEPVAQSFPAGGSATWRFRVVDCDGNIVRSFEPEQSKLLHLIVARTDFTSYQHLHPTLGRDGTWSVEVKTPQPGRYRAMVDFVTAEKKYVVGTTLVAPGKAPSAPLPPAGELGSTDGYEVSLERPAVLKAGEEAEMTFSVKRHGKPVTDLQPYLGAYGHLVALHAPDLAYSHVHPTGEDLTTGAITFDAELHRSGAYRLFLQFQTHGRVHTVAFTQNVS